MIEILENFWELNRAKVIKLVVVWFSTDIAVPLANKRGPRAHSIDDCHLEDLSLTTVSSLGREGAFDTLAKLRYRTARGKTKNSIFHLLKGINITSFQNITEFKRF